MKSEYQSTKIETNGIKFEYQNSKQIIPDLFKISSLEFWALSRISDFMLRISLLFFIVCVFGCQTVRPVSSKENPQDAKTALTTAAKALTGKDLTDKQLNNVVKDIENNPQTQTAVNSVAESLKGNHRVKYSPSTGKRYAPNVEYDPETGVKLKWVDE
ncbi:MAG: hypothetical protein HQL24_04925 [Candidatus Omnitrophica bacterium]|nr:hypothetical protein [Candidatus Omnitrophota bacterium]